MPYTSAMQVLQLRSCMKQVVQLVEHVNWDFAKGDSTQATLFYIKRPVERVWYAKLLAKLASLGLFGWLYQFIEEFLNDRLMVVWEGSATSKYHALDMSVTQGSVIAPILFIAMLQDLRASIQKPCVDMSLFLDDFAIWQTF